MILTYALSFCVYRQRPQAQQNPAWCYSNPDFLFKKSMSEISIVKTYVCVFRWKAYILQGGPWENPSQLGTESGMEVRFCLQQCSDFSFPHRSKYTSRGYNISCSWWAWFASSHLFNTNSPLDPSLQIISGQQNGTRGKAKDLSSCMPQLWSKLGSYESSVTVIQHTGWGPWI